MSPRPGRRSGAAGPPVPPGPASLPFGPRGPRAALGPALCGSAGSGSGPRRPRRELQRGGGGGGRGGQWPPLCGAGEGGTHTRHGALCDAPSRGKRCWRPPLFELRCCRAPVTQLGPDLRWSAPFCIIFFHFIPPSPRAGRDRWLSNPRERQQGQEEPISCGGAALALGRSREVGHGDGPSLPSASSPALPPRRT